MYAAATSIRVRYAETDQMGYVYYGQYAAYYEVGRVECLRSLGVTYKSLEQTGVMMPVLESRFRYFKPARYDELIRIDTLIRDMPSARVAFEYELYNEQGEKINQGETTLVFVSVATGRPCRMPLELERLLKPYFS